MLERYLETLNDKHKDLLIYRASHHIIYWEKLTEHTHYVRGRLGEDNAIIYVLVSTLFDKHRQKLNSLDIL